MSEGRPTQSDLLTTGSVKQGVATTVTCMKSAKPSVLTARKRPGTRRAGRPTMMATTAVTAPAKSSRTGRGIELPRWAAMSAPTATRPNCPSDTCPAQPVSTVSDRAMTAKMQTWAKR